VDVTNDLRPGRNVLEVSVTNEWTNRIAADRALPASERVLSDVPPSFPGAMLSAQPSGLGGEVTLVGISAGQQLH
jgi:hypothetical protein